MSRTKLKKFKEINNMPHVIQPQRQELLDDEFTLKGRWSVRFGNNYPICLELGCGKGEYTVALAKANPKVNYIGIDIKGSRIYSGAEIVRKEKLLNVIFIRTQIEHLASLFNENEVNEIWITFPDPQLKYNRRRKRLVHSSMLKKYQKILINSGVVHLKTDSLFLHGYALGILENGPYKILHSTHDLYKNKLLEMSLNIKTYYEQIFLNNHQPITYLSFSFL